MTSVILNNISLKYQRFTSFGCRNIGIRKLGFVAKTQFLYFIFDLFIYIPSAQSFWRKIRNRVERC